MANRKPAPKKGAPKRWNNAEILYAFCGWLSTREQPLTFSTHHRNSEIAQIIGAFAKANGLPEPRKDYPKVKVPAGTDHLNNLPTETMAAAPGPMNAQDALRSLLRSIDCLGTDQQDVAIGAFLEQLKAQRMARAKQIKTTEREIMLDAAKAEDAVYNLEKITRGDYAVLTLKTGTNG